MAAMAVRIAGSGRFKRRASKRRRRMIFASVAVVVLVAAAIAWQMGAFSVFSNKKVAAAPRQPLTAGAKQSEDIGLVAGAVGQYAAANGALPTSLSATTTNDLVLCGITCVPTNFDVNGLSYYQASGIKLVPSTPGLSVSNPSMIYLVPGAKCGSGGLVGGENSNPRSMVLLYMSVENPNTPAPRCIVL